MSKICPKQTLFWARGHLLMHVWACTLIWSDDSEVEFDVECYVMSRTDKQDMESVQTVGTVQIQQPTNESQVLLQVAGCLHQSGR